MFPKNRLTNAWPDCIYGVGFPIRSSRLMIVHNIYTTKNMAFLSLVLAFSFVTFCHLAAMLLPADAAASKPQSQLPEDVSSQLYDRHVRPLFEEHCQTCHSTESKQGGLDLSSAAALLRGGTRGAAITPGNAKTSLLYRLLTHEEEPAMPYKAPKLSKEAIALVELWINLGGHVPASQPQAQQETQVVAKAPAGVIAAGAAEKQFIDTVR